MNHFEVTLTAEAAAYRPGDVLEGDAFWRLDEPASALTLKVCWTTDGDFAVDAAPVIVHEQVIPVSGLDGKHRFRVDLPQGPWSFQGKLFLVHWYAELCQGEESSRRTGFVLAPEGKPVMTGEGGAGAAETPPEDAS